MKRRKTSSRAMRGGTKPEGKSAYARKVAAGNRMYGSRDKRESCCAHRIKLDYWGG